MRYLLDTDVIIDYLRSHQPSIAWLNGLINGNDELYVSAVTNLELHAGESITKPAVLQQIKSLLGFFKPVDINFEIAAQAGEFKRKYRTAVPDALIAACALSQNAVLLTRNIKDFKAIKEITIQHPL